MLKCERALCANIASPRGAFYIRVVSISRVYSFPLPFPPMRIHFFSTGNKNGRLARVAASTKWR